MKKLSLLKICVVLLIATFPSAYANEFMENLEELRKKKIHGAPKKKKKTPTSTEAAFPGRKTET